ncbi:MAG: GtrA family protein [Dokdonella sp.]
MVARSGMLSRQFFGFVLVSGIAGLANFGSRFLFSMAMPYWAAICSAFVIGLTTAFVLNRRFIFAGSTQSTRSQALRFLLVNLAALVQTLAVSLLLARSLLPLIGWQWHPEAVAHAVGIAIPAITSYLAHKHWTFS